MPLNQALVGREYPTPGTFEVGREHIRQFAEAIGDDNPIYLDPEAAKAAGHRDVLAPPTFLTVLNFRFRGSSPMADPELGVDYSRIVHGDQSFTLHRPVYVGDVLRAVTRIDSIRAVGGNEFLVTVIEVTDSAGETVATLRSTVVSRGTAPKEA
jgi:acyl dehydratase